MWVLNFVHVGELLQNHPTGVMSEVSKETKGWIDSCTLSCGYLSVYKTKKDWDHEKREYRRTRIPIVGRKYEVFTRDADNSNWETCREGYTDINGRVNHRKGSVDWKWYRINVSNEGDDDYVRMIYDGTNWYLYENWSGLIELDLVNEILGENLKTQSQIL